MPELLPLEGGYYVWEYLPSLEAAVIFAVVFALATSYVTFQSIRTRTLFAIPFIIGGICAC